MHRVQATVTGTVQGVFYRASTQSKAEELGLCGWVRNLPSGQVELVAEGDKDALDLLIAWCHEGPPYAEVQGVDVTWDEADAEFSAFSIKR